MVRLCGGSLGLFAFSVAVVQGLLAGNPTEVTLWRAIGALAVFCTLGLVTGWIAFRVLDEHALARHRQMFPETDDQPVQPADAQSRPGTAVEPPAETGQGEPLAVSANRSVAG